jgi:short-subunit dehydrogenase
VILARRSAERLGAARLTLGDEGAVHVLAFDMTDTGQVDQALTRLPMGSLNNLIVTAARVTHGRFAEQPVTELRAMFACAAPHVRRRIDHLVFGCPQPQTRPQLRRVGSRRYRPTQYDR